MMNGFDRTPGKRAYAQLSMRKKRLPTRTIRRSSIQSGSFRGARFLNLLI
jgi:hypothetical protein